MENISRECMRVRVGFMCGSIEWILRIFRGTYLVLLPIQFYSISIQLILYRPISQITYLAQRALQSVHIRHP